MWPFRRIDSRRCAPAIGHGKVTVQRPLDVDRRERVVDHMRTYEPPGEGCDEQRFTKFRYRNYKYYLAKPLYLQGGPN